MNYDKFNMKFKILLIFSNFNIILDFKKVQNIINYINLKILIYSLKINFIKNKYFLIFKYLKVEIIQNHCSMPYNIYLFIDNFPPLC